MATNDTTSTNPPKVSVLFPVWNGEEYLKEAIESILNQTFQDFECIIINDGSTDSTKDILEHFSDPRLRIYHHATNKLIAPTLNEAIAYAQGEYLARMDADDIAHPDRLREQVQFLDNHPEIAVCGTWADTINEYGQVIGELTPPKASGRIALRLVRTFVFIHPSVMIRKTVLDDVGGYNPKFSRTEDYELWTRVLSRYRGANIPKKLLYYRITSSGITQLHKHTMRLQGIVVRLLYILRIIQAKLGL